MAVAVAVVGIAVNTNSAVSTTIPSDASELDGCGIDDRD
jgi:hypothetical protein